MDLRTAVDDLVEITVVGSFSSIGPTVRRRLHRWRPPEADSLRGATALVTGPTSGLGREAAGALAGLGARVILVGRSHERLRAVRDDLVATHGEDRFPIVVADLSSLADVSAAIASILASDARLDVLLDNAGTICADWTESTDGIETTFATMVVGPFALVGGLLPLLRATPGAPRHQRHVGRHVRPAPPHRRSRVDGRSRGTARRRTHGRSARARSSASGRDGSLPRRRPPSMHPGWADTPGCAPRSRFRPGHGPDPADACRGRRYIVWLAAARRGHRQRPPLSRPPDAPVRSRAGHPSRSDRASAPLGCRRRPGPDRRPGPGPNTGSTRLHPPVNPLEDRMTSLHERIATTLPPAAVSITSPTSKRRGVGSRRGPRPPARRRADRRRHPLRARRPDGRSRRPDDVPDHGLRAPRGWSSKGEGPNVQAIDDIRFEPATGRDVEYTADIRLAGWMRLVQPFLGGAFAKLAGDAAAAWQRTLDGAGPSGRARAPAGRSRPADARRRRRGRGERPQRSLRPSSRP